MVVKRLGNSYIYTQLLNPYALKSNLLTLLLLSIILFQATSKTPDWVWARSAQSGSNAGLSEGTSVATDSSENVYVAGIYIATISFGSYTLTSQHASPYLAKYDSSGNVIWAKGPVCSVTASGWGSGISTDAYGNIYFTGYFTDIMSFGSHTLISVGGNDMFLVKYDSSGNVLWAKSAGSQVDDYGIADATDAAGNVYVTGRYRATPFILGPDTLIYSGGIGDDIFLAKYDSSGNVLWAKNAVGMGADENTGIATDASGNVYITGYFYYSDTLSFGPYMLINANAATPDFFLAKYSPSGNVLWAKSAGGTGMEEAQGIATDALQNIYVTGYFTSASVSVGSYTLSNAGSDDAFFVKYDSSGNVLWAKSIGGTGYESGHNIATDKSGRIYLTVGSYPVFSSSLTFDTIAVLPPTGSKDPLFIVGYNSSGHALFVKALASGGDDWSPVAVAPSGCIYVDGDFWINPLIVGHDTLTPSVTGTENVFVAKLCYSGPLADFNCSDTTFCNESGQCIDFYDHSTGNPTSWHWLFPGANPSSSNLQNPTNICYTNPGTYPVTLIVSNGTFTDTLDVSPLIIYGTVPSPPTITVVGGDTLVSSHGSSYQWYFNGAPIAGATDSFYVEHQSGTYAVQITDNTGGCNSISNGLTLGVDLLSGESGVSFFPNPFHNKLTVVTKGNEVYEITLFDITSRELLHQRFTHSVSLNTAPLAQGVYLYEVRNKNGLIRNGKLVKE